MSQEKIHLRPLAEALCDLNARQARMFVEARRDLSPSLTSLQLLVLQLLLDIGPMTVGQLREHLYVQPAQMSRVLRSLEENDRPLVTCQRNDHDRRRMDVVITEVGREVYGVYLERDCEVVMHFLKHLNPQEQRNLATIVRRLREVDRYAPSPFDFSSDGHA